MTRNKKKEIMSSKSLHKADSGFGPVTMSDYISAQK